MDLNQSYTILEESQTDETKLEKFSRDCPGFIFERQLGERGTSGEVFLAYHYSNRFSKYAVKVASINTKIGKDQNILNRLFEEYETLVRFNSPFIIKVYGLLKGKPEGDDASIIRYYLILEYCEGGDLQEHINNTESGIPESQAKNILYDLIQGLQEIHGRGVLHRDLKPANILLKNSRAVIADLGSQFTATEGVMYRSQTTTNIIDAPEIHHPALNGNRGNERKSDVWSLGVCAYMMLYKSANPNPWSTLPTGTKRGFELLKFPADVPVSDKLKGIIKSMLVTNPQDRVSLVDLLEDPYFDNNQHNPVSPVFFGCEVPTNLLKTTRSKKLVGQRAQCYFDPKALQSHPQPEQSESNTTDGVLDQLPSKQEFNALVNGKVTLSAPEQLDIPNLTYKSCAVIRKSEKPGAFFDVLAEQGCHEISRTQDAAGKWVYKKTTKIPTDSIHMSNP